MRTVTSKWSPRRILRDQLTTLVDARTGRPRPADYLSFYLLPVVLGLGCWLLNVRFESVDPLLSGTSIFTALLFGVLVYVFQLKVRIRDSETLASDFELKRLIDELEINVSYTALVGLVSTALMMALAATKQKDVALSPIGTAAVVTLLLHLSISVLMVLKRTRSAYSRTTE